MVIISGFRIRRIVTAPLDNMKQGVTEMIAMTPGQVS